MDVYGRNLPVLHQSADQKNNLLSPTDGKRRYKQNLLLTGNLRDEVGELVVRILRRMDAAAIGGLANQVITFGRFGGIVGKGIAVPANVT